ncbi:hypothetical protein C2845_PM02G04300 [Panicum miliaceum]|uniref:Uncharacterized protein n=1 Tax=Panicum miliaceum TaxID=4540 RepID=A0A3L6SBR4_PANMI|nr:hypothetical protein C2845_PM02G04300 [Panicum miliaceum]
MRIPNHLCVLRISARMSRSSTTQRGPALLEQCGVAGRPGRTLRSDRARMFLVRTRLIRLHARARWTTNASGSELRPCPHVARSVRVHVGGHTSVKTSSSNAPQQVRRSQQITPLFTSSEVVLAAMHDLSVFLTFTIPTFTILLDSVQSVLSRKLPTSLT